MTIHPPIIFHLLPALWFFTGAINLPMVAVGVLLGGVVMKRARPSVRTLPWLCLLPLTLSVLLCGPLFFMGCSTQRVAGVNAEYGHAQDRWTNRCAGACRPRADVPPRRHVWATVPVAWQHETSELSIIHTLSMLSLCCVLYIEHLRGSAVSQHGWFLENKILCPSTADG